MKRRSLFLFLFAIMAGNLLQAQIKKGTIFLGGDLSFSHIRQELEDKTLEYKTSDLTIWPTIGKAIKDNLIVGVYAIYNHGKLQSPPTYNGEVNYFSAGILLRQYLPVIRRLYLFGQCHVGPSYSFTQYDIAGGYSKVKSYGAHLGIYPGLSFAVNKKIHLESGFIGLCDAGFSHSKMEVSGATGVKVTRSNSFGIGANLNNTSGGFTLGVRYLIEK